MIDSISTPEPGASASDAPASDAPAPDAPATELGRDPGPPIYAADDRPRGLDSWFAPGGEDDASPERKADERRLLRLLLLMVVLLVAIPTILTVIAFVGQLMAGPGAGG